VTFLAFIIIGSIPPLLYYAYSDAELKLHITIGITILLLFLIGVLKGYMEDGADMNTMLGRGTQTAVLGSIAGAIAYVVTIYMSGMLIKK
jgi:VIT1/CCC1 family predicted Fe2+/Mn2+ transporter